MKTKYKDIIKAEEYLEKIFNISFSMPKSYELKDFIKQYDFFNDDKIAEKLERFFKAINFTNPRHLKKVLNKYAILIEFKNSKIDNERLIPEIIRIENGERKRKGYLFDTVFVLYFIILYEFYYGKYLEVKRYKCRLQTNTGLQSYFERYSLLSQIMKVIKNRNANDMDRVITNLMLLYSQLGYRYNYEIKGRKFYKLVINREIRDKDYNIANELSIELKEAGITVDFWEYIKNNYEDLIEENYPNPYPFTNLFKMVETYL
nr:hypothetical protein [Methanocaldococcus jannaschii]